MPRIVHIIIAVDATMPFAQSGEHGTPEETSDDLYENFFWVNILFCVMKGFRTDDDYVYVVFQAISSFSLVKTPSFPPSLFIA